MQNNSSLAVSLQKIAIVIMGIALLVLPILYTSLTTDPFTLPKQIVIAVAVAVAVIVYGISMVADRKMFFRGTPFDIAILLFTIIAFASAVFAVNRIDSLTAFFPFLFAVVLYFSITNLVKKENDIVFLVSALVIGALVSTLLSVFQFFNIYLLPFADTHAQGFTTYGSFLDQAIYLAIVLPLAAYLAFPLFQNNGILTNKKTLLMRKDGSSGQMSRAIVFAFAAFILLIGLLITLFELFTTQKPLILPFATGFQTAFASISQDTTLLKSFLLGSGFGTYLTDFTRFKSASYNLDQTLWSVTFVRSTSFFLELIATTGFLGALSFLFLVYRVIRQRVFFLPLVIALLAAFLLPFSPVIVTLFFVILAIFASLLALHHPNKFPTFEFHFVAFNQGLVNATPEGATSRQHSSRFLPSVVFIVLLALVGVVGYFTFEYLQSDMVFEQSLVAARQNKAQTTYDLQRQAISIFPYRDLYYTVFSQTNLALANSLAASQPKNKKPDATVQNTILQLIQQSITSGRAAVSVAPETASDWNNLSSIYRSLIGFGQNADAYAIATSQQAIALDPKNPQQYINLGGIYYQLGQWDNAITQFTYAWNAKSDYANAYYNLGHAYEAKGDLNNALQAYQVVQQLVSGNKANSDKISAEIKALQNKINSQTQGNSNNAGSNQQANTNNGSQQLNVSTPPATLPSISPKAEIPGPSVSPVPSNPLPTSTVKPTSTVTPKP